jgi:flavin reductase (DIM6/NTAB) family NADH-FMN oxidoreductase RutF
MKTLDIQQMPPTERQQWLQAAVAPRPICFASTISRTGQVNLSPFSFFNLFSIDPAVVVFSPSRRLRDNTTKHTLQNVLEVPEVVINIVDYDMVHQTSLASCEYKRETNEFTKAGFTMQKAMVVSPPMVQEAKVKLECRVMEVKSLGERGGAGQLVIAEILRMHVEESILSPEGKIDPLAFRLVARLGGDWYCRVDPSNLFTVPKPNTQLGIGIDALPAAIKNSAVLTGNHLGQLANVHEMPVIDPAFYDEKLKNIFQYFSLCPDDMEKELHLYARELLNQNKVHEAWQVLLTNS